MADDPGRAIDSSAKDLAYVIATLLILPFLMYGMPAKSL